MGVEEGEVGGGGLLGNLNRQQRIIAIVAFVAIIILSISLVGLLLSTGGGKPREERFVTIYKQLTPKSVGNTIEKLKEERIPYEIRENGTAIAVERARQDEARVELAKKGLPEDGVVGFELFDKGSFISTDFEKKVSLQRAINGEMSRLIKRFDGIQEARVSVVVPEPQLFQEQQQQPTASVLIQYSSGGGFKPENIETIAYLIASSVNGLNPANVTIVDTEGNMLATGQGGAGDAGTDKMFAKQMSKQMEVKRDMEKQLENKIIDLVEKVVGPGRVKTKVTLDVDFSRTQVRKRDMAPILDPSSTTTEKKPMVVAKKTTTEKTSTGTGGGQGSSQATGAQGVAGTASNTGTPPSPGQTQTSTTNTTGNSTERGSSQETYNFNNTEELTTLASGVIKERSVSVFYQMGEKKAGGEEAAAEEELGAGPAKLTTEDIKEIVKKAINFNDKTDQLAIREVTFDDTLYKRLQEEMDKEARRPKVNILAIVLLFVGLIVGFGIAGAILGKKKPQAGAEQFGALGAPQYAAIPPAGGPPPAVAPGDGGERGVPLPPDSVPVTRAPVMPPPENPFDFLRGVSATTVAQILSSERLPTLVAVLAQLEPAQAEEVINYLTPEIQNEIRSRLETNPVLPPMTQKMVSQSLRKRLSMMGAAVS